MTAFQLSTAIDRFDIVLHVFAGSIDDGWFSNVSMLSTKTLSLTKPTRRFNTLTANYEITRRLSFLTLYQCMSEYELSRTHSYKNNKLSFFDKFSENFLGSQRVNDFKLTMVGFQMFQCYPRKHSL